MSGFPVAPPQILSSATFAGPNEPLFGGGGAPIGPDLTLTGMLNVDGTSTLDGLVTAGSLSVPGISTLTGPLVANSTAAITGPLTIGALGSTAINLQVFGNSNLGGGAAIAGGALITGPLSAPGGTVTTTLNSGSTTVGSLTVTGNSTLGPNTAAGNLNVSGTLTAAALALASINVPTATISTLLNVPGNTTLNTVSSNSITSSGSFQAVGPATIGSVGSTATKLVVNGAASISNNLSVAGASTLTGLATLSGGCNAASMTVTPGVSALASTTATSLNVSGLATLNGGATAAALTVTGTTNLNGVTNFGGGLNISSLTSSSLNSTNPGWMVPNPPVAVASNPGSLPSFTFLFGGLRVMWGALGQSSNPGAQFVPNFSGLPCVLATPSTYSGETPSISLTTVTTASASFNIAFGIAPFSTFCNWLAIGPA